MQTPRYLSLTVQGIYVLLTGLQLIFVPNLLIGMFGFEEASEIWIKVLGIVVLALSVFYYAINKSGNAEVVMATVWARLLISAGFIFLVISGQTKPNLILFSGIDIATAVWTWFELKKVKV